jgi:hypothetical protein
MEGSLLWKSDGNSLSAVIADKNLTSEKKPKRTSRVALIGKVDQATVRRILTNRAEGSYVSEIELGLWLDRWSG